jgi:hypothetical protein
MKPHVRCPRLREPQLSEALAFNVEALPRLASEDQLDVQALLLWILGVPNVWRESWKRSSRSPARRTALR